MAQNRLKSLAMAFDRETNDILQRGGLQWLQWCNAGGIQLGYSWVTVAAGYSWLQPCTAGYSWVTAGLQQVTVWHGQQANSMAKSAKT